MCAGFDGPLCGSKGVVYPTLAMLLRACKRGPLIVGLRHRRLPVATDVLCRVCAVFNEGCVLTWRDEVMCAACTLAFFTFMRCGEFTVRGGSSAESYLCIDDVDFSSTGGHMNVFLRSFKADPFKLGVSISVYEHSTPVCPVRAMRRYLQIRNALVTQSTALFLMPDFQPMTRQYFLRELAGVLTQAGIGGSAYSGHSFRIETAGARGIHDHLIQTLGRWTSQAYIKYIHVAPPVIQQAQLSLSHL